MDAKMTAENKLKRRPFFILATIILAARFDHFALGGSTPVQYCQGLAATSCEVLNVEPTTISGPAVTYGIPTVLIKYCRNQKFAWHMFPLASVVPGSPLGQVPPALVVQNNNQGQSPYGASLSGNVVGSSGYRPLYGYDTFMTADNMYGNSKGIASSAAWAIPQTAWAISGDSTDACTWLP